MEALTWNENQFFYQFAGINHNCHNFHKWWDKRLFNWTYSSYLAKYCSSCFEKWWDPETYNWESVNALIRYCHQYFHIWWNPEKFNWKPRSTRLLMNYLKEQFDIWWDPNRFPWKTSTIYLIKDLPHKFLTWWDEERFPWHTRWEGIPIEAMLIKHCRNYFNVWYFSKYFRLTGELCALLKEYCQDFKDLWAQDYLLYKLTK